MLYRCGLGQIKPGRVWTGGNPNFDEIIGCFTGPEFYKNAGLPGCSPAPAVGVVATPGASIPAWVWLAGGGLLFWNLAR